MRIKHNGRLTVAAHRGDCYNCYENTMRAFEAAIRAGAAMIETDLHLTSDGVIVLIHDHTLDRTTDSTGPVCDKTLAEIKKINAGDKYHFDAIPELEELLRLASENNVMLNLEFKEYYSEENEARCIKCIEDALALVEKYNMTDKVIVNSFDAWILEYVYKHYGKKYMLHGFYPYSIMQNVTLNPEEYLYCACIFENGNKSYYDYLNSKGIEPWIGAGVTQRDKLLICIEYGARLITTNNPSDVISKLNG
ncbi:MAG: hypothetical protein IKV53_06240 [Clostridia bacterium]|nr:hypothetical protein [Clostridia bacterium]